ncbi:hypothetical protein ACFL13_02560 [Patescibacteria group bacterium]
MKSKIFILIVLVIILLGGGVYFLLFKMPTMGPIPNGIDSETGVITDSEPKEENTKVTDGYKDDELNFDILFPAGCGVSNEELDTYGWPNGVVLIYCGGETYDVAVEVWDTEEEFRDKYPDEENLVVEMLEDGRYLTVVDIANEQYSANILKTFRFLD